MPETDVLPEDHLQDNLEPPPEQIQPKPYERTKVLGQGNFGKVEQFSSEGKRDLVKKTALGEDTKTELENESKVLDTLGQHENIVQKSNEDLGGDGLALEMLKGGNVGEMMESLEEDYRKGKINHTVTLERIREGRIYFRDPYGALRSMPEAAFAKVVVGLHRPMA